MPAAPIGTGQAPVMWDTVHYRQKVGATTAVSSPNSIVAMTKAALAIASRLKVNRILYQGRCPGPKRRWTNCGRVGTVVKTRHLARANAAILAASQSVSFGPALHFPVTSNGHNSPFVRLEQIGR